MIQMIQSKKNCCAIAKQLWIKTTLYIHVYIYISIPSSQHFENASVFQNQFGMLQWTPGNYTWVVLLHLAGCLSVLCKKCCCFYIRQSIAKCWNNDSFVTQAFSVWSGTSNWMSSGMSKGLAKSQLSFKDLQPKIRWMIVLKLNRCFSRKYLKGDLMRFA